MNDPFRHMNLAQIEEAVQKARAVHPILFHLAEFHVFARDPIAWVRHWRQRKALGYDGRRRGDAQ